MSPKKPAYHIHKQRSFAKPSFVFEHHLEYVLCDVCGIYFTSAYCTATRRTAMGVDVLWGIVGVGTQLTGHP